jgi:hypothetical protein
VVNTRVDCSLMRSTSRKAMRHSERLPSHSERAVFATMHRHGQYSLTIRGSSKDGVVRPISPWRFSTHLDRARVALRSIVKTIISSWILNLH